MQRHSVSHKILIGFLYFILTKTSLELSMLLPTQLRLIASVDQKKSFCLAGNQMPYAICFHLLVLILQFLSSFLSNPGLASKVEDEIAWKDGISH